MPHWIKQYWKCLAALVVLCVSMTQAFAYDQARINALNWTSGPTVGDLGAEASINVQANYDFLGPSQTVRLLEILQQPVAKRATYAMRPHGSDWLAIFEYDSSGRMSDEETLEQPAKMLEQLRQAVEIENRALRSRGMEGRKVTGWFQEPQYDSVSKFLSWGVEYRTESSNQAYIVHNTVLLGGNGNMRASLFPDSVNTADQAIGQFRNALVGYQFAQGQRYSETHSGRRTAVLVTCILVVLLSGWFWRRSICHILAARINDAKHTDTTENERAAGGTVDSSRPWHIVLGVSELATDAEISAAYKRQISQYHPDKVATMGADIRAVAEARSKEINDAYSIASRLRNK